MTTAPLPTASEVKESWLPLIATALGQALMSFNVASLPVALSGMVHSFDVPPTTVATGIVMYSLAVAAFVMLGGKLTQRFGALHVFRAVVLLFGGAQVLMTFSPTANLMLTAQVLAALAGAALVPSLVALIANQYHGQQQAAALGALGSARAGAGVLAFLIGGVLLQAFIVWTRRRTAAGKTPLLALAVVRSPSEQAAVYAMFAVVALEGALNFSVPLDIMGNERLLTALERTGVSPGQIEEAVRINEEARLRALKIGLLVMAALSFLAIFRAGRLPSYKPGEIPANPPPRGPKREEELAGA